MRYREGPGGDRELELGHVSTHPPRLQLTRLLADLGGWASPILLPIGQFLLRHPRHQFFPKTPRPCLSGSVASSGASHAKAIAGAALSRGPVALGCGGGGVLNSVTGR